MICVCMFDFRKLNVPTCSYKEMTNLILERTVIPVAQRFANKNHIFTLIQTFDRRADDTKGSTEITRSSVPVSPLEYRGMQINPNELIKSFNSKWLDQDNGRQKIITAYARLCQDLSFIASRQMPVNFNHIIIGGSCGIHTAYSIDRFGGVNVLGDDYPYQF